MWVATVCSVYLLLFVPGSVPSACGSSRLVSMILAKQRAVHSTEKPEQSGLQELEVLSISELQKRAVVSVRARLRVSAYLGNCACFPFSPHVCTRGRWSVFEGYQPR